MWSIPLVCACSQLYRVLNIRVVLVEAITWTSGDQITVVSHPRTLLDNFEDYHPQIQSIHDSAMLLTYVCVCSNRLYSDI